MIPHLKRAKLMQKTLILKDIKGPLNAQKIC